MQILRAKSYDKENIKNLWKDAFLEEEPFLSWYFNNFWREENSLCAKNDENVLSGALTLIPYSICVKNNEVKSSYIAGVSVPENMRMMGIAKKLMREALSLQINRGEPISLLIPFNYDFYRKMGYEVCYDVNVLKGKLKGAFSQDVVSLSINNYREMNILYNKFCQSENGYILRDLSSWEYILNRSCLNNTKCIGINKNKKLLAYLVYTYSDKGVVFHEFAGDECYLETLFRHAAADNENITVFSSLNLSDKRIFDGFSKENKPTVMARITDVELAVKYLPELPLKIKICDGFIEKNNCTIDLKSKTITDDNECDLIADIRYFTQFFMGYKSLSHLIAEGKIQRVRNNDFKLKEINYHNYINLIMSEEF